MEQGTKYLCFTLQISTEQWNPHLHMWFTWSWFRCRIERKPFGIFILLLDAKGMGWRRRKSKWRTNETDSFPYLFPLYNREIEEDRNCKLLLFIFIVNKLKWEQKWVPIVSDLCINTAYYSAGLNEKSKKKWKPAGESKTHDNINTGLWQKNVFTTSEMKGNREKYALKLSLPLSYSSGDVTKGTNWPQWHSFFQATALK